MDRLQLGQVGQNEVFRQLVQVLVGVLLGSFHLVVAAGQRRFQQVELRDEVLRVGVVEDLVAVAVQAHQVCVFVHGVQGQQVVAPVFQRLQVFGKVVYPADLEVILADVVDVDVVRD